MKKILYIFAVIAALQGVLYASGNDAFNTRLSIKPTARPKDSFVKKYIMRCFASGRKKVAPNYRVTTIAQSPLIFVQHLNPCPFPAEPVNFISSARSQNNSGKSYNSNEGQYENESGRDSARSHSIESIQLESARSISPCKMIVPLQDVRSYLDSSSSLSSESQSTESSYKPRYSKAPFKPGPYRLYSIKSSEDYSASSAITQPRLIN